MMKKKSWGQKHKVIISFTFNRWLFSSVLHVDVEYSFNNSVVKSEINKPEFPNNYKEELLIVEKITYSKMLS